MVAMKHPMHVFYRVRYTEPLQPVSSVKILGNLLLIAKVVSGMKSFCVSIFITYNFYLFVSFIYSLLFLSLRSKAD